MPHTPRTYDFTGFPTPIYGALLNAAVGDRASIEALVAEAPEEERVAKRDAENARRAGELGIEGVVAELLKARGVALQIAAMVARQRKVA